jgi:large subunit ribosomal protein L10
MDNPRPEKVAVVEEVRGRFDASSAAVLTEYRGLGVSAMAELRRVLRVAGADYKVYKNTLVKLAVTGRQDQLLDLLSGPVGIAFVSGEISAVAKALRDYARANPALVLKGGLHGDGLLSAQELGALADLPSREVLLSRFAAGLAAPMQQLAGLMQALPRNLAYGLKQLLEQRGGDVAQEAPPEPSDGAGQAEGGGAQVSAEAPEAAGAPEAAVAPEAPADREGAGDAEEKA